MSLRALHSHGNSNLYKSKLFHFWIRFYDSLAWIGAGQCNPSKTFKRALLHTHPHAHTNKKKKNLTTCVLLGCPPSFFPILM